MKLHRYRKALFALAGIATTAAALAAPAPARAQANVAVPDSLLDWRYKFTPVYEANSRSDVTAIELGNTMTTSLVGVNGLSLRSIISVTKKKYRLQNKDDQTKRLTLTFQRPIGNGFTVGATYYDNRQINRTILITGGFQDLVFNDEGIRSTLSFAQRPSEHLSIDAQVLAYGQDSERVFKNDETQSISIGGGITTHSRMARYLPWIDGDNVKLQMRGYKREANERSQSSTSLFPGLGASEDSLSANAEIKLMDELEVGFDFTDYRSERKFADQQRGSLGAQQGGEENLFIEREIRDVREYGFNMTSAPMTNLEVNAAAFHSEQVNDYDVNKTRFSRTVTDEVNGDVGYTTPWGTVFNVRLQNRETIRDFGPLSVSSYDEVRKRANMSFRHGFGSGLSFDVALNQQLSQSFYKSDDNQRDRDQLDSSVNVRVSSNPFPKVSTSIFMALTGSEYVNVRENQDDNRVKTKYDMRPAVTYQLTDNVSIEQQYGLAIEFTEFTARGTDGRLQRLQDNFLDRNITFSNRVRHQMTKRLSTEFYYKLTLHDRGSYLPSDSDGDGDLNDEPEEPRFLDVEREDRRDQTEIRFRYQLNEHLALVATHDYSRKSDETIATGRTRVTTDGGIEGGVVGTYDWSGGRQLSFTFKRAERFSPFNREEQNKYWIGNLAFKYTF